MNKFWPNRDCNGQLNKKEPQRRLPLCDGIHVYTTGMVIVSGAYKCAMSTQLYILEFSVLTVIPTESWMALHQFASTTSLEQNIKPSFQNGDQKQRNIHGTFCSCSIPHSTMPYPTKLLHTIQKIQQWCIFLINL